jgi:hypothetical protein
MECKNKGYMGRGINVWGRVIIYLTLKSLPALVVPEVRCTFLRVLAAEGLHRGCIDLLPGSELGRHTVVVELDTVMYIQREN